MFSLWIFRWFWLMVIFYEFHPGYVMTDWPSLNSLNVQLLGIFSEISNLSDSSLSSIHCHAMVKSAIILSQKYNITIQGQYLGYQSIESDGNVMDLLADTCRLVSNSSIVGIVGPALSRESDYISLFAGKLGIPVISYAATDPELSDRNLYPSFYRTVPSDDIAALAIVDLFIKYNWTSCIIIYQNDAFGSDGAKSINEQFNNNKFNVINMIEFDILTLTIKGDLKSILANSPTRIIILWAESIYSNLILENALENDLVGPLFLWILSSTISLDYFNETSYENLNGLFIIEPVVADVVNAPFNSTLLNAAYQIWQTYEPQSFPGSSNVDYYALFAFDATWTLLLSLQKLCSINNNNSSCIQFVNNSFCFDRYFLNRNLFSNIINNINYLGVSGSLQFSINTTDRIAGINYIIKNVQLSSNNLNSIPVLVWSQSNSWIFYSPTSVILWPGNSLIVPSSYASLTGVNLRIAVTATAPFTIVTQASDQSGETQLIGYVPDLIELLRNKMGFIPIITLIPSNYSFNEIIDLVANNEYDMFVAQTTITSARTEEVDFSDSIYDNSLCVLIRKESTAALDLLSYIRPFSFQVWISVAGACLYASVLIYLLERRHNRALQNKSIIALIGISIWYSIGTLTGHGVDFHVVTAPGRVLTIGLYFLSLVLVAAYTAKLAAELTISQPQTIIDGIDDIKNSKIPFNRIGILVGSSFEEYYLQEISDGDYNFYPFETKQEIYDALLDNVIDASIMDTSVSEYITANVYCNLTIVGTDFDPNAFGIVFQKNWQYEQIVDVNILALREAGDLDELQSKWFKATYCSQLSDSASSQAMTLESLAGLFITFAGISMIAILLFIWRKRFIIKGSLLKLLHRKNLLIKQDAVPTNLSISSSCTDQSISEPPAYDKSYL